MSLWWIPAAWLAIGVAWIVISTAVNHVADRRYARLARDLERRKLRYDTWRRIARLGSL